MRLASLADLSASRVVTMMLMTKLLASRVTLIASRRFRSVLSLRSSASLTGSLEKRFSSGLSSGASGPFIWPLNSGSSPSLASLMTRPRTLSEVTTDIWLSMSASVASLGSPFGVTSF